MVGRPELPRSIKIPLINLGNEAYGSIKYYSQLPALRLLLRANDKVTPPNNTKIEPQSRFTFWPRECFYINRRICDQTIIDQYHAQREKQPAHWNTYIKVHVFEGVNGLPENDI